MDTHTPQPIAARSTTISGTRPDPTTTALALVSVLVVALTAAAQTRQAGARLTPDQVFKTVWVVDRTMPDLTLWQTLVHLTSSDGFQPIVIHGEEGGNWTPSLEHLLAIVPQGASVWVSEAGTRFDVDRWTTPRTIADDAAPTGPPVFSADESLDDVAALVAMRLDGALTAEEPAESPAAIMVGVEGQRLQTTPNAFLPTRADALAYTNQLAESSVVMVVRRNGLLPEHVLWAFQRDAKILEVDPPPYDIYDAWSEFVAVEAVSRQIHDGLPDLLGDEAPEALVIAGDWYEIPFRFPYGLGSANGAPPSTGDPFQCATCDNGVYEYAADLVYANLDEDPSNVPDVPVGRLMSPYRDLLAIQTVIGIWRGYDAFAEPTEGVFLGLLGTSEPDHRRVMFNAWRDAFPGRSWSAIGPETSDVNYHLDRNAFFRVADRAEIVIVYGHGHPDFLSPNGSPFNKAVSGKHLRERIGTGVPSFWFLHACGTGKPDRDDHVAGDTLLVGLQSRLAFGSLMAVENVAGGSSDPYWWIDTVEPGFTVGELVRRFAAAGAMAYRDGEAVAQGMPATTGSSENRIANGLGALSWIGDPLTPVAAMN